MSKSVDVILGAVKAAGEAALRLHEENKALAARLAEADLERDKALVKADTLQFLVNQRDIDIHALRARLAGAERIIRLAYGGIGTLRRMAQEPKARTSYEEWQRHADAWLSALERPCTCHPDDNPPVPCPRKYALTECRQAALERTP